MQPSDLPRVKVRTAVWPDSLIPWQTIAVAGFGTFPEPSTSPFKIETKMIGLTVSKVD